jgi:UDP-glucose 4-epimerase
MRVLITGGGGNLGRVLAPALEEAEHEPILMDNRDLKTPHETVRGDVRDGTELLETLQGTDVVVHAAALHGIHLDRYTTDDFWDLNVAGTRNVYEAARECGIGKILLCSTMGIYGEGVDSVPGTLGRLRFQQEAVRRDRGLLLPAARGTNDSLPAGNVRP